jgi:hypothetical protein
MKFGRQNGRNDENEGGRSQWNNWAAAAVHYRYSAV